MAFTNRRFMISLALALFLLLSISVSSDTTLSTSNVRRVNMGIMGAEANNPAYEPSLSADGHFVAFSSSASNLVPNDLNGKADIFVFDRFTNQIERVSLAPDGEEADDHSWECSISGDGRLVVLLSAATNFAPVRNPDYIRDIFLYDRQTQQTSLVSVSVNGLRGNGPSYRPLISANGQYVVFESHASDLVADDTNNHMDIFVRDLQTDRTICVSRTSDGRQANGDSSYASISGDGQLVSFYSIATNLVEGSSTSGIYIHNRSAATTTRIDRDGINLPSICQDGHYVVFTAHVWGTLPQPYYDILLYDVESRFFRTAITGILPVIDPEVAIPRAELSGDGRFIIVQTADTPLIGEDINGWSDIVIHDTVSDTISLISRNAAGDIGNGDSSEPSISADGRIVAFLSHANNLVSNDTNGCVDVFLFDGAVPGSMIYVPMVVKPANP